MLVLMPAMETKALKVTTEETPFKKKNTCYSFNKQLSWKYTDDFISLLSTLVFTLAITGDLCLSI